ncbi:unnamed protein product [Rotaria sp. Silwood2]|nr:unnamed protein product [Rotaria sp. Silwood2]
MNLFEFLVLSNREDMIRLRDLRSYFNEFSYKTYPDLLSNINHVDAYWDTCYRCRIRNQADSIQVHIYECPLPSNRDSAFAVIFELQMPIEIRSYHDIVWQFWNRPKPHSKHQIYEWFSVSPHQNKLGSFYTGPKNCKMKLVSVTKSVTKTHYSCPSSLSSASIENFRYDNSLSIQILPTNLIGFNNECCILTPQLNRPEYKQLQFTINTTEFV